MARQPAATRSKWVRFPPASLSSKVCRRRASGALHPASRLVRCVPYMGYSKARQIHHLVSSVGRASDLGSECHGFDSHTRPQARNLLPCEGNRRVSVTKKLEGGGRPFGRLRVRTRR